MIKLFQWWFAMLTDPSLPAFPPQPKNDGRKFGWQRSRGGARSPATPVIVYGDGWVGGEKEMVGNLHMLKPHEYGLSLDELAGTYPCPPIETD